MARLDIDAADGVLREVDGSQRLDVNIRYTPDERVKKLPGRHQTSVGNSTYKITSTFYQRIDSAPLLVTFNDRQQYSTLYRTTHMQRICLARYMLWPSVCLSVSHKPVF